MRPTVLPHEMIPRKFLVSAVLAVILAALGFAFAVHPAYQHYRETRAVRRAQSFLQHGDFPNASLCARQALRLNPSNLAACQLMAQLAGIAHSPQLVNWEQRVAALSPTPENQLRLASAALIFEPPPSPLAAHVLEEMSPHAKSSAPWQLLSAQLALKCNDTARAEAHFLEAARLEPDNPLPQLNLAALRLKAADETLAGSARSTLVSLSTNPAVAPIALRWLISDSLGRNRLIEASAFSESLLKLKDATLEDQLQHLEVLKKSKSPGFTAVLQALERTTGTNTSAAYALCGWMNGAGLSSEALAWIASLSPQMRNRLPLQIATVECLVSLKNWPEMERMLEPLHWGQAEFLRRAFLSRAAAGQTNVFAASAHWRQALRLAGNHPSSLQALLKLSEGWDGPTAREELLWHVAQTFPHDSWALESLNRLYTQSGDTLGLRKLAETRVARNAQDFAARNDLAATSLLLRRDEHRANALAAQLYQEHPQDPIIVSTYAFSLHLQRRTREGLLALQQLRPAQLEMPSVALYYGALLRAVGESNQAEHYFALAKKLVLLPEERELLEGMPPRDTAP